MYMETSTHSISCAIGIPGRAALIALGKVILLQKLFLPMKFLTVVPFDLTQQRLVLSIKPSASTDKLATLPYNFTDVVIGATNH